MHQLVSSVLSFLTVFQNCQKKLKKRLCKFTFFFAISETFLFYKKRVLAKVADFKRFDFCGPHLKIGPTGRTFSSG
jgi:hypothetical protein